MKKLLRNLIFIAAGVALVVLVVVAIVMIGGSKSQDVSDNKNLIAGSVSGSDMQNEPNAPEEEEGVDMAEDKNEDDATNATDDAKTSMVDKEITEDGETKTDSQISSKSKDVSNEEKDKPQSDKAQSGSASDKTSLGTTDVASKNPATQSGQNSDNKPAGNTGSNSGQNTGSTPSQGGSTGNQGTSAPSQSENATPHICSFDNGRVTTEATCKGEGVKTYTCGCGQTKTESIPKTSHNYVTQNTAASCTESGVQKTYCSICGDVQSETVVAATGHVPGEKYYWYGPPRCDFSAYYAQLCAVCGQSYGDGTDPALPHTTVTVVTQPPKCNDMGVAKVYCSVCGKDYDDGSTPKLGYVDIPMTGEHTWITVGGVDWDDEVGDWVQVTGEVCSVCGKNRSE